MTVYDVIVIGTGSAGSTVAQKCRSAGWNVAIVDSRPYGGTCALRGCDPKKVLLAATEAVHAAKRLEGKGVTGSAAIDWASLQGFKQSFTEPVPSQRESAFKKAGIDTLHGKGHFLNPTTLEVDGREYQSRHFVIATGAKPRPLEIAGEEHVITSTDFLNLEELPDKVAFIGGGFISFEFAHMVHMAGKQATILHRTKVPLKGFDSGLVRRLIDSYREAGIDIQLDSPVTALRTSQSGFVATTISGDVHADLVVHGAGRIPDIDDLDLQQAGVEHSQQGVVVDEWLRTTNPNIYAAGDVVATGGWPLTPVASMEGHVVASNLLGKKKRADYRGMASVVFSQPPLARVGEADSEDAEVHNIDMDDWFSYRRLNQRPAQAKILIQDGVVIGAHILGHDAAELINVFSLAIRQKIPVVELKRTLWAYPSIGSDIPHMV
jgi:glutathione reductase (NADPH)